MLNRDQSPVIIRPPSEYAARDLFRRGPSLIVRSAVGFVAVGVLTMVGLMSGATRAEAAGCTGPLNGGEIRVVLVVDATDLGGGASSTCLVVPAGTTGSQLLARRGAELGTGSPRYGSSGLLCAIDGRPATGCGDRNGDGFGYWAYFYDADGSWSYGNGNPFAKRPGDGAIEGWRFVAGGCGCAQDPSPRISPSRSLLPSLAPSAVDSSTAPQVPLPGGPASNSNSASVTGDSVVDRTEPSGEVVMSTGGGDSSNSSAFSMQPVNVDEVALASARSDASTTGRWAGVGIVLLLIAGLAGGAWKQTRRTR